MTESIRDFVLQLLRKRAPLPAGTDLDSFNYVDSGHVDSIGIIKFIVEIEAHFDISLSESDIESSAFRTVGGIVAIIVRKSPPLRVN